jgi:hypothetical protein
MTTYLFYFGWNPVTIENHKHPIGRQFAWVYVCSPPTVMVIVMVEAFWKMRKLNKGEFNISKRQIAI